MNSSVLEGGFSDPAREAARGFRGLLEAMARPGTLHEITGATPPSPVSPAAGAVLLTLCDAQTPLYLAGAHDTAAVRGWIAFHTGAPFAGPGAAKFALGTWDALQPLSAYPPGLPAYPDRSATLIVELHSLDAAGATLTGPGIADSTELSLPETAAFQANRKLFPLGLDFLFAFGSRVAALPRSTEVA